MTLAFNRNEFRKIVAQKLCDIGVIPEPVITEDNLPYITAFVDHVAASTLQLEANTKLLNLLSFIGQIASQFRYTNVSDVGQSLITDALIETYVSNAAARINLDNGDVIRAIQSCLGNWRRGDSGMESVMFRIGNLMIALGVLTTVLGVVIESANDIERAPDPEPN